MLNVLIILMVGFLAIGVVLRLFENSLLYYPASLARGILEELSDGLPATWGEVEIETEDEETIVGWYGRP